MDFKNFHPDWIAKNDYFQCDKIGKTKRRFRSPVLTNHR